MRSMNLRHRTSRHPLRELKRKACRHKTLRLKTLDMRVDVDNNMTWKTKVYMWTMAYLEPSYCMIKKNALSHFKTDHNITH